MSVRTTLLSLTLWLLSLILPAHAALLYRVEHPSFSQPSYLFGTMHIVCRADFRVPPLLESHFETVEQLVMEIDMTSADYLIDSARLMVNHRGPYLAEFLSLSQLNTVEAYLQQHLGIGRVQAERMQPFVLSVQLMMSQLPCDSTASFENHLLTLAMAREIPVKGLETAAFQMGLFEQIPLAQQVEAIWQMIRDPEAGREQFIQMTERYFAEDVQRLYQLVIEDYQYENFHTLLLDQRNQDWLTKLPAMMRERSSMIAVGAAHLAGEQGLIQLLRQAGYEVTPLGP